MNIFLPIIAAFTFQFTPEVFEDGSIRVNTNRPSVHSACVRSDMGCTPDDTDTPHELYEDGSVRMWLDNNTVISFCAYVDMGCSRD